MVPRRRIRDEVSPARLASVTTTDSIISLGPFPQPDSEDSVCFNDESLKMFSSNLNLELLDQYERRFQVSI